ncbi:RseC/MucC-like positive regulator of sigma(E) [Rhodovulum bhavnagarense]|uniref:RseC/MucC-like positive regulator of sigma(E) n=1 Tax=Rhodovulum bhavnagarense TaxID=992286 RepID=A0A4V2SWB9_9RHOB|nr:RseC/MucC-like positive regulator of sigma(E) [Rhodovulum bhavnagarense]
MHNPGGMMQAAPPGHAPQPGDGADPRVLRRRLRVAGVDGGIARLEVDRLSGCTRCAVRAGCGTGALAQMLGSHPLDIRLRHTGGIAPGDEVVVAMSGGAFLGAAGLAYLLPPATLVSAAAILSALGLSDIWVALSCLPVLALSLLPAWLAGRRDRLAHALRIEDVIARGQA